MDQPPAPPGPFQSVTPTDAISQPTAPVTGQSNTRLIQTSPPTSSSTPLVLVPDFGKQPEIPAFGFDEEEEEEILTDDGMVIGGAEWSAALETGVRKASACLEFAMKIPNDISQGELIRLRRNMEANEAFRKDKQKVMHKLIGGYGYPGYSVGDIKEDLREKLQKARAERGPIKTKKGDRLWTKTKNTAGENVDDGEYKPVGSRKKWI